jgi:hypothetical protein
MSAGFLFTDIVLGVLNVITFCSIKKEDKNVLCSSYISIINVKCFYTQYDNLGCFLF